jgi:STELLO glycosyltransferases
MTTILTKHFLPPRRINQTAMIINHPGWINVYKHFTSSPIWPRGFPLDEVLSEPPEWQEFQTKIVPAPIQQGLVDNNPDVDALYRLLIGRPITFDQGRSIALYKRSWSPFNSQNTTWWKCAFPLLYLPATCSFRVTDIWRSFVAQRIAWECGWPILYHCSTVYQKRNEHSLMKDFEDEIPGYLQNSKICTMLDQLDLKTGENHILCNLQAVYQKLVAEGWIDAAELPLVEAWCLDIENLIFN